MGKWHTATLRSGIDEQIKEIELKSVTRILQKQGQCYAIKIDKIKELVEGKAGTSQIDITKILNEYASVLSEPQEFLPKR